ncbi:hypothetical protein G6F42_022000 [Rhizopus arrhizus]|nr:hypothetical protein G6F42_022000 [Rhizopus arrhizus]
MVKVPHTTTIAPTPTATSSTPLPGTPAALVSPVDFATSAQYQQLKTLIQCSNCAAQGSLVKFGFTKANPPRPRFKCNQCTQLFGIQHVEGMISLISSSTSQPTTDLATITPAAANPDRTTTTLTSSSSSLIAEADCTTMDSEESATHHNVPSTTSNSPSLTQQYSSTSESDVINFLLNSVQQLTEQANTNQAKFDYITTLIEQNKKLELDLQVQKNENIMQKKEIEKLKKLLEQKNTKNNMNTQKNITQEQNTQEQNTQKNTQNTMTNTQHDTDNITDSSDFPLLTTATDTNTTVTLTYAQQAQKKPTKIKYARGQYRSHQPTAANLELATQVFNAAQIPPTAEYKYLYFPCNKRMKPSVIRQKLTLVGVDNLRILDAHCPDWNTIALLIHTNYETDLLAKFHAAKVNSITYDYCDPIHLRDQRHASLSREEKVTKLNQIFKNNLLRSLSFMRYPTCHSVSKFFHRQEILTTEELESYLHNSKQKQIADAFPPNATNNQPSSSSSSSQEALQSPIAASDTTTQL